MAKSLLIKDTTSKYMGNNKSVFQQRLNEIKRQNAILNGNVECGVCKKLLPKSETRIVRYNIPTGRTSKTIATDLFGNTTARQYITDFKVEEVYMCSECYYNMLASRAKTKKRRCIKYLIMVVICFIVFGATFAYNPDTAVFTAIFTIPLTWFISGIVLDKMLKG